jgi:polar amino acid transport system substrate-binding protein
MRRILPAVAIAATAAVLAACGSSGGGGTGGSSPAASPSATAAAVFTPWFIGNNPSNGKGYESAVAYEVAKQLGFSPDQVKWVHVPFNASYAPGPKKFDFDINEISFTPERASAVTFSDGYYDVEQALVALKGTPIVTKHSPSDLKGYVYGDQVGTTSLAFINSAIQPTARPRVFQTLNDAKQALQTHQIAALVADTPTAQFISSSEIKGSVVVGRFPSSGEHFGMVFEKGNPLAACVNQAIAKMKSDGTLDQLTKKWLQVYTSIPSLEP